VRIAAADFWALSRGEKNPFELLMDGKIRMQGRMEVAMALSSVLIG
jgi:putative sterol carrier protein